MTKPNDGTDRHTDEPVWPKRAVLPDGTEILRWEGINEAGQRLARLAGVDPADWPSRTGRREDHVASSDDEGDSSAEHEVNEREDDESWLDDYVEGSTTKEFLHRMKNGMLLFGPDATAEEIASAVADRRDLQD